MKRKTRNSIIVSSLGAIALAGSLLAGSTYALFTSKDEVNIAVTSGKVDIKASISGLKTYSGVDLIGNPETDVLEETTTGNFTNGGTANIDGNTLTLDKMTPGDKATFNITITNYSNVNTKYRTIINRTESSDSTLFNALKFNIGGVNVEKSTIWKTLNGVEETGTKVLTHYDCSVELPSDIKGTEYMDKSCGITYTVEAIQGNATTSDENAVMVVAAEASESITGKINAENETTETIYIASNDSISVETEAETQNISVASAIVPEGAKIASDATELSLNIYESEKPANFEIKIGENQTSKTLEIEMKGLDDTNEKPLTIKTYIGKGFENLTLYHNDGKSKMTKKDLASEVTSDQDYHYDSKTGFLTIATSSFSPFTFIFDAKTVNTAEEFVLALADQSIKNIRLGTDIVIATANYNVNKRLNVETDNLTIDLCNNTLTVSNCTLTIIGNNVTITNGKMIASKSPTQTSGNYGSYTMQVKGKNTAINGITMIGGINVCGNNSANSVPDADVTVTDCDITATGYYTVCVQDNSSALIKNSTLTRGNAACFWIEKKGYSEGNDTPAPVDSKLSYEKSTVTINGDEPLYNTVGVAPIELCEEGNTSWAYDLYTLEKALDDENINTIKLNKDINLEKALEVNRSVTIDFCGKTVKASKAIEINTGDLIFKDSAERAGKLTSSNSKGVSLKNDNTSFELNDITIECTSGDAISFDEYRKVENTTILINSGKIIAKTAIRSGNDYGGKGHTVTINGGSIECEGSWCGIFLDNNCTLTFNSCDYTMTNGNRPIFVDCKDGRSSDNVESSVIINDINFIGNNIKVGTGNPDIMYVITKDSSATGENILINKGKFTVDGNVTEYTTATYPYKNN